VEDLIQLIIVNAQSTKVFNSKNIIIQSFIKSVHTQNQNVIPKENYVQFPIGNASSSNNSNIPGHILNYAKHLKNTNSNDTPKNNDDTTNTNYLIKQFSMFITDFNSVINPLISLLTTVINKIILKNH